LDADRIIKFFGPVRGYASRSRSSSSSALTCGGPISSFFTGIGNWMCSSRRPVEQEEETEDCCCSHLEGGCEDYCSSTCARSCSERIPFRPAREMLYQVWAFENQKVSSHACMCMYLSIHVYMHACRVLMDVWRYG
jgi:hypothetical protein